MVNDLRKKNKRQNLKPQTLSKTRILQETGNEDTSTKDDKI